MISKKDKKILIIFAAFFSCFLIIYVIQNIYINRTGKIETEFAFNYVQEKRLHVKGFAVRDESSDSDNGNSSILLRDSNKTYVPVVQDSTSVGIKSTIAYAFNSQEDAQDYLQLQKLYEQLEYLEELNSQVNLSHLSVVHLNSGIYACVDDYVDAIGENDLSSIDSKVNDFVYKMSVKQIATGNDVNIESKISEVKSQISSLEKSVGDYTSIKAPFAGYFVSSADGYESVKSYDDVVKKKISVNEGAELIAATPQNVENAYGKIISNNTWYFIFDTSISDSSIFRTGYYLKVSFPNSGIENIDMMVYDISELKGDTLTVTLKCTKMSEEISKLRIEDAEILVEKYEGLRISESALEQNEDGLLGVYVVLGTYVKFTPINVYYYGDGYVIAGEYDPYEEDEAETDSADSEANDDGSEEADNSESSESSQNSENEEPTKNYRKIRLYDKIVVKGMNLEDGQIIY